MCTGKCSLCISSSLYPLAVISIICNIVLFFPGGDVKYAQDGHITEEVKYMGGLVGGGLMVSCLFSVLLLESVTLVYSKLEIPHLNIVCSFGKLLFSYAKLKLKITYGILVFNWSSVILVLCVNFYFVLYYSH